MSGTIVGPDGEPRCAWSATTPEFVPYHDAEWGFPVGDDRRLFEKLSLEAFQAGLSWRTILGKRESFRRAFLDFDIATVARFGPRDVERLLEDASIVRHRGKIEAVINNAQRAEELIDRQGSLAGYLWSYEPDPAEVADPQTVTTSPASVALSNDLKKQGWRFVGPTTVFAFIQAMGLINDHLDGCVIRPEVTRARQTFVRPV